MDTVPLPAKETTPVVSGSGNHNIQRYKDGLGHAPSKGNQTWKVTKNEMTETYLSFASELGLKHECFPWEEEGTDIMGNTNKTLWMYLIVSGWAKLADVELNTNPKKGFFGVMSIKVKGGDLRKFNSGMIPIVYPAPRVMIADSNKMKTVGLNERMGSLNLTRRVLGLIWSAAGFILHSVHPERGDICLVFDRETFESTKKYNNDRKAKRRERGGKDDGAVPEEAPACKKKKTTPALSQPVSEEPTATEEATPPSVEAVEKPAPMAANETPLKRNHTGRYKTVLREELIAEHERLKSRLKTIAQTQGLHEDQLQMLRADHAASCAWLQSLGNQYTLEESRLLSLNSLRILHTNEHDPEDQHIRLHHIETMRLSVEQALGQVRAAYFHTNTRIGIIASEILIANRKIQAFVSERCSTERLRQSVEMRCTIVRFDD